MLKEKKTNMTIKEECFIMLKANEIKITLTPINFIESMIRDFNRYIIEMKSITT